MVNFSDIANHSRASTATYIDSNGVRQTVSINEPRTDHHIWNGSGWVKAGQLLENEARTNLLLNSNTLATQTITVTAAPHTLHFTGTGTITLSGASTGSLVGTGTGEENRVSLTFTPSAGTLTCTVSGTVTSAQLEEASTPSSYIPTSGSTATRAAETLTIPAANLPAYTTSISIQMDGTITYADRNRDQQFDFVRWITDNNNFIKLNFTTVAGTGRIDFRQAALGVADTVVSGGSLYSPGIDIPFNIASRHGSTFVNGAVDGTALIANTTPTAIPDLSATNLTLGFNFMGTIKTFRIWVDDIEDVGIAEASS